MSGPYGRGGCGRFSRGQSGLDLRGLSRHYGDREFDTSLKGFGAGFTQLGRSLFDHFQHVFLHDADFDVAIMDSDKLTVRAENSAAGGFVDICDDGLPDGGEIEIGGFRGRVGGYGGVGDSGNGNGGGLRSLRRWQGGGFDRDLRGSLRSGNGDRDWVCGSSRSRGS